MTPCEGISPVTGVPCRNGAHIVIEQAGTKLYICAACALHQYRNRTQKPATRTRSHSYE